MGVKKCFYLSYRKENFLEFYPIFLYGNRTKNRGPKSTKISFYDTFIVQNSHFTPNNYEEIVLKIGTQNGLESAFTTYLL